MATTTAATTATATAIRTYHLDRLPASAWHTTADPSLTGINSPGVTPGSAIYSSIDNRGLLQSIGQQPNALAWTDLGGYLPDHLGGGLITSAAAGLSINVTQKDGVVYAAGTSSAPTLSAIQLYIAGQLANESKNTSSASFRVSASGVTPVVVKAWSGSASIEVPITVIGSLALNLSKVTEATLIARIHPTTAQPLELDPLDMQLAGQVSYPTVQFDLLHTKQIALWNHAKTSWDRLTTADPMLPQPGRWSDILINVTYDMTARTHTFQQIEVNGQQVLQAPVTYPFASGQTASQNLAGVAAISQMQLDGSGACYYERLLMVKESGGGS
jgi:hypothetical protein